jgi:hypothetical protein
LVQQLGLILGGGLSPLIAIALLAEYGWTSVAGYMVAIALLSADCVPVRSIPTSEPILRATSL